MARNLRESALVNLVKPRPGLLQSVPTPERVSRQEMLRIADSYFDSIEQTNGDLAPFADDCARHENGVQPTTNKPSQPSGDAERDAVSRIDTLGCRDQINSRNLSYITKILPRRLLETNGFLLPYGATSGWE